MEEKEHNRKKKLTPEKIQILDKLKKLRTGKNLSQSQIAKLIDISQAAYAKIESGDTFDITIDIGKGIAKALGMSFNELFEIEGPSNSLEIEEFNNKILLLEREIKLKDRIIADYSNMFDNYREQLEYIRNFYSETGMMAQLIESAIDKIEGAPTEMKEEMKALFHAHLSNTKSSE